MPKTGSFPGDVPRYTGDDATSSRVVTVPHGWFPKKSLHFFTDFVLADQPVKVRYVCFDSEGRIVGGMEVNVHRDDPFHSGDLPAGTEAVLLQRKAGTELANKVPVGLRIDIWE